MHGASDLIDLLTLRLPRQLKRLRQRVRLLERSLADSNIELALERQYTRLACQRAGIEDVAGFKKKAGGKLPTGP